MKTVGLNELRQLGEQMLVRKGLSPDDARYIADVAVTTEAAGVHTHGAVMFTALDRTVGTATDPARKPRVVKEKGATALIDCEGCIGQIGMRLATDLARKKAREFGVAMIAVRDGSWLGGLCSFVLPLAREGFFVQLWAQSRACKDSAPYGGVDPRFSTNPVGIGFPTDGDPVVADFSTSVMSMGKVNRLIKQGEQASEPCFFDRHGQPTADPQKMKDDGAMFLWGGEINGFKGFTMAAWAEALTAMAGGRTNNPELEQRQSFNLTVIDPEAFVGMKFYRAEMKRFVEHVKSSRVREGFDGIRFPGERLQGDLRRAQESGTCELDDDLFDGLNGLAEKHGLERLAAK
jgi:LDH2 family malate/lactate/ureidoglycolate dehydrogenase